MRTSVAQAKARFSEMIEAARGGEPVIVTRHGEPVVAVVAVPADPDDRERFLLAHNPIFRSILEETRGSGDPIPHDDFWKLVAKRRTPPPGGAEQGPSSRRRTKTRRD
ncbi:type II toxin-antitoxin system prevent-host-death family antitoxin [Candidatus Binatia bacterium]|nr:type II toxin-antitoxin system prevent-host-death family antitoxin [Candidatus Binatia bacterium]